MFLLDVNIVLAAHRDDHPHHQLVRPWFDELTQGTQAFAVPAVVWASFLRLATNRRIFRIASPLDDAFGFIEATVAQPNHLTVGPGARHLHLLRELCEEADAVGDLVPDAVVATLAAEHAAVVITLDRDFARFSSVEHRRPA